MIQYNISFVSLYYFSFFCLNLLVCVSLYFVYLSFSLSISQSIKSNWLNSSLVGFTIFHRTQKKNKNKTMKKTTTKNIVQQSNYLFVYFFCTQNTLKIRPSDFICPSVRSFVCPSIRLSVCLSVTLFHLQTVFVIWLLGCQLFVDILYIFVNGTSRAIF